MVLRKSWLFDLMKRKMVLKFGEKREDYLMNDRKRRATQTIDQIKREENERVVTALSRLKTENLVKIIKEVTMAVE